MDKIKNQKSQKNIKKSQKNKKNLKKDKKKSKNDKNDKNKINLKKIDSFDYLIIQSIILKNVFGRSLFDHVVLFSIMITELSTSHSTLTGTHGTENKIF